MNSAAEYINTVRLRVLIDLSRELHPRSSGDLQSSEEPQSSEAPDSINESISELMHDPQSRPWISPNVEESVVRYICRKPEDFDLIPKTGRECMQGILEELIMALPATRRSSGYLSWIAPFMEFFHRGLNAELLPQDSGSVFHFILVPRYENVKPGWIDTLFACGLLESMLEFLQMPHPVVLYAEVPFSSDFMPLTHMTENIKFKSHRTVLEVKMAEPEMEALEFRRHSPRLRWHTGPEEAFVRQVTARSAQLFHDRRELKTAVEYLHMANETLEQQLANNKKDIRMAANIQKGLIPAVIPDWEGMQTSSFFQPKEEVSGDIFDFFQLGNGRAAIMAGDVSGHGVPSALITAIACVFIRNHSGNLPAELFHKVNYDILKYVKMEGYLTAFYGILDSKWNFTYSLAGFPSPVIYRKSKGELNTLSGGGPLLGMFPDAGALYKNYRTQMELGDKLFIFSDGLLEGRNIHDEQFGIKRLMSVLKDTGDLDAANAKERILAEFSNFTLGAEPTDDITLLVCYFHPKRDEFEVCTKKAALDYRRGDLESARKEIKRATEILPNSPPSLYLESKILLRSSRPEDALESIDHYEILNAHDPNALTVRACCMRAMDRLKEAERFLMQSLELRRENISAMYHLADLMLRQGRNAEAKAVMSEMMRLFPIGDKRLMRLQARLNRQESSS